MEKTGVFVGNSKLTAFFLRTSKSTLDLWWGWLYLVGSFKNFSIMSTVYLKDGVRATLVSKINEGFLVKRHLVCQKWNEDSEDEEEFTEESDQVEIAQEVFQKAPRSLVEAEYQDVVQKVLDEEKILSEKRKEISQLNSDIYRLKNSKSELTKMIFNKEDIRNANRLIVFRKGQIAPHVLSKDKAARLTISYEITSWGIGEEKCWAYTLYSTDHWSNGDYYDAQYGIMKDLSDEELRIITHERIVKRGFSGNEGFSEGALTMCPDEWLTPELIERKKLAKVAAKQRDLANNKTEVEKYQKRIATLENEIENELTVS